MPAASGAPAEVLLSPSLMRMGVPGRLALAAACSCVVWAATLAVVG